MEYKPPWTDAPTIRESMVQPAIAMIFLYDLFFSQRLRHVRKKVGGLSPHEKCFNPH